jgi:DedD protein
MLAFSLFGQRKIMAENRRGKDRRYYFTLPQMLLLAAAFTVTALVIFFFGIYIGKGIEARKIVKPEEPLMKLPVKPSGQASAAPSASAAKEDSTFYDTLESAPATEPPAVNGSGKIKPTDAPVKMEPKPAQTEAKPVVATAATRAALPPPENGTDAPEAGKIWSIQVNAYPDERSARLLVDRLNNKGYNAVMTETRSKGRVWYRVRVGKYASREAAEKAMAKLKSRENFENAFAASTP